MKKDKAVERVQKLIALAASSNENEARNAAFQACKIIRENKLEVVAPGRSFSSLNLDDLFQRQPRPASRPWPPPPPARSYVRDPPYTRPDPPRPKPKPAEDLSAEELADIFTKGAEEELGRKRDAQAKTDFSQEELEQMFQDFVSK